MLKIFLTVLGKTLNSSQKTQKSLNRHGGFDIMKLN